ncbi:unknown [Euproctis pseudoconspersa nucleopolyhedrovirus]|uniref:Uncharacterized protein n=1 Tax=Euproctis pseudoconspersa nucleopolyhedrovirus TaxID=307467 RepID=C3TWS4_9ABAC|nr:hypothetical protein EupsNPV_gp016 [Euproctis pseudoconspersa nucleopolyhedrovirus]ACO53466.1 unknown [Euproctis pseudoconspersa nucleopolyhedrovirus]QUJ09210.1 hypothetical protein Gyru_ORF15 [Gynaephora ruoergensis nucleopolyhedrovirus]
MNSYKLNKIFNRKIPHIYIVSKHNGKIVSVKEAVDDAAALQLPQQQKNSDRSLKYYRVDKIVGTNKNKHYVYRCVKENTTKYVCI